MERGRVEDEEREREMEGVGGRGGRREESGRKDERTLGKEVRCKGGGAKVGRNV